MRIVLFGNAATNIAAIRYRVIKFATMLEAEGHTCIVCLPSSFELWEKLWDRGNWLTKILYLLLVIVRRIGQLRHVPGADAVFFRGSVIPYGLGPPVFERCIQLLNPRMIYDIDDAVWERPDGVDSPALRFVDYDWVWKMCGMCVHGIVGNEHLKGHVEKHNPAATVIPTCIDMDLHTAKPYEDTQSPGPVVLGWTGLWTNLTHMDLIAGVLVELAAKHDLLLSVATGRPYHLDGVKVVNHQWEAAHEIDYLQEADIGLMPLMETKSSTGKCSFKALQYMGVATPCVISPVGMNAEVIEDGVNGFLADSPEEWHGKLERLILDAGLRKKMGMAARQTVVEGYSHQVFYPTFKKVMETVAAAKRH